jgi:hypothetical protein
MDNLLGMGNVAHPTPDGTAEDRSLEVDFTFKLLEVRRMLAGTGTN